MSGRDNAEKRISYNNINGMRSKTVAGKRYLMSQVLQGII
jgi:hypothetical protein